MKLHAHVLLGLVLLACAHAPAPPLASAELTSAQARALSTSFVSPSSYVELVKAELHASRGELREAIAGYRAAIDLGEDDPLLQARLAELLDRAGATDQARRTLKVGLAAAPRSEALWRASARIARAHADPQGALDAYERAHAAAETLHTAFERIDYLRELGHAERALAALEQLATAHLIDVQARARVDLELAIARNDAEQLVHAAKDWLALGARDPVLSRRAAEALLAHGHPITSLQVLDAVPTDEANAALRLRALHELGRTDAHAQLLSSTPSAWLEPADTNANTLERSLRINALPALAREVAAHGRRAQ